MPGVTAVATAITAHEAVIFIGALIAIPLRSQNAIIGSLSVVRDHGTVVETSDSALAGEGEGKDGRVRGGGFCRFRPAPLHDTKLLPLHR